MSHDVVVVGVGMITAVGLSAAETAASVRAGIARFVESDFLDQLLEPVVLAWVPDEAMALTSHTTTEDEPVRCQRDRKCQQTLRRSRTDCSGSPHSHCRNVYPTRASEQIHAIRLGFCSDDTESLLADKFLPNLEDPAQLITSWTDQPRPACIASVASHWEWRTMFAGTEGAAWQNDQAPFLPAEFDTLFFQLAAPDLCSGPHRSGGERVDVRGASQSGLFFFHLPSELIQAEFVVDGDAVGLPCVLDCVLIEPDAFRVQLTWRAVLRCDKDLLRVSKVVVVRQRS